MDEKVVFVDQKCIGNLILENLFSEETEKFSGFEIVVSTHCDRDHIHSHFVMNSVNAECGRKFHSNESDIKMLMKKSDDLCREYGLSVIDQTSSTEKGKPMSDREYRSAEKGESWKIRLLIFIAMPIPLNPLATISPELATNCLFPPFSIYENPANLPSSAIAITAFPAFIFSMTYSGVRRAIPVPLSLAEMNTSSQISSAYTAWLSLATITSTCMIYKCLSVVLF